MHCCCNSTALCFFVAGCSGIPTGDFTADARTAIGVSVSDNVTRQSILIGSTIIVTSADVRDSITVPAGYTQLSAPMAPGRSGTFTVVVRHAGYRDAIRSNIVVTLDGCGRSNTIGLDVSLVPAS